MEEIGQLLKDLANTKDHEIVIFLSLLEKVHYKKNDLILQQGEIENHLYFLKKGILRSYVQKEIKNDWKETTFNFTFPGMFYSCYDSFLLQKPCKYSTQCLTDTEIYRINYSNLQEIYTITMAGQQIGRLMAEMSLLQKMNREISLLTDSVDERYIYLQKSFPHYLQEIPLKYIASYIGVTPQALSKIRKRVFK